MRAREFDNPKENFVDMFRKFLPIAIKVLRLESLPKIIFEPSVNSPDQPTFGQYVNNEKTLYVGLSNRHPNDILRTLAHELVHYKQDLDHKLNDKSGSTGSPEENEANALAGIVMRNFNKQYPEFLKGKPVVSETWSEKYKRSINCSNPKGFSQRAHCQGRKKDESAGDRGDIQTGPQQQLIPFPKGTSMVDVSDVYDWYKLGMVISDLDDADPSIFGKGAPHTVIAFGSEEEEHKMLPLLKRLGLKIHDIDRPEDVKKAIPAKMFVKDVAETIRKVGSQYRLVSKSGKNLGTYPSRSGAEKRERQVQYFKHVGEKIVAESKSAPLYHFTTWNNLVRILLSNQLIAPAGKIYLTRDYTRQFIPHEQHLLKQPYGLRLNQELLSRDYGRKLQAGGQDIGWDEKKRQAWLADPKNAREIEIVKQTGRGTGSRYDGADPEDIVRGTVVQSRRWESEEHLNVKNLPNLDKYITGIIIGKAPIGGAHRTKELEPDPLTKLADTIIHLFSGPQGFDQRNWFLDTTAKLSVPIIYDRKEYDSAEVKKRIIQLYSQRKKEREEEQSKPQKDFMVITSPAGGGIVTGGSDINVVFNKLVKDPRHTNREIYGYSIGLGPDAEKKMFDKPIPLLQLVKNPQAQGITENNKSQYIAALYVDEFADGDHWYIKGTPDVIQRFVQLANSLEDEVVKGTEYEPGVGMMAKIHKDLGDDSIPQWKIVPATNLEQIKPITGASLRALMTADLSDGAGEFMSEFLWNLEEKGQALVHDGSEQGVLENFADGRNPQDKGDSARHGIRKGMTIAQLKKIRSSNSASPRKKQLAHWQINMRQGRKK